VRTPVLDVFRPAAYAASRAYFGLRFCGLEHIPADGPLLVTPNHQTYADPPLVTIPFRRPLYYMAWEALFEVPGLGRLIRRLRAFPVALDSADRQATREAVRLLEAGQALMIFPEGGRSPDGRLQPFKLGAFRLAAAQGAAVLPVTIAGGNHSWPPGRWLPRPGRITITFHPVLRVEPAGDPKQAARDLADRTRAAISSALTVEPVRETAHPAGRLRLGSRRRPGSP
jgi:1-acyl-sn-glycerol-3-phosphate acyltransferase